MVLVTIPDVAFVILSFFMGSRTLFAICIFLGGFLIWPALVLLTGLIHVIKETCKPSNKHEKVLLSWAIISALVIPTTIAIGDIINRQARYYYVLPDNSQITIWQNRIIFEKYISPFPPRTNYIQIPSDNRSWQLTIDSAGRSAIYTYNTSKIKQVSPKYPLVAVYEGKPGEYWFYKEFPPEVWMVYCSYEYMSDGLASCGMYDVTTVSNDSAYHIHGYFPGAERALYDQDKTYIHPLDSLIDSYKKNDYYDNYYHWSDSVHYSAFHNHPIETR